MFLSFFFLEYISTNHLLRNEKQKKKKEIEQNRSNECIIHRFEENFHYLEKNHPEYHLNSII